MPPLPTEIIARLLRLPVSAYPALEAFLEEQLEFADETAAYAAAMGNPEPEVDENATNPVELLTWQDEMDKRP